MTILRTPKVIAYVTQADRLLVFRQPAFPAAGIQVPAGTLEPGEAPAAGVLREAREETGISHLELVAFLGTAEYDMAEFARAEIQVRHFFHLACEQDTPERWTHHETGGGKRAEPIEFELFWVRVPHEIPEIIAGQGALLAKLQPSGPHR